MKQLTLEMEDRVFTELAEAAHCKNITLNEYVMSLLAVDAGNPQQLKLDMGEPYSPASKEAVTQANEKEEKGTKDLTRPPFKSVSGGDVDERFPEGKKSKKGSKTDKPKYIGSIEPESKLLKKKFRPPMSDDRQDVPLVNQWVDPKYKNAPNTWKF